MTFDIPSMAGRWRRLSLMALLAFGAALAGCGGGGGDAVDNGNGNTNGNGGAPTGTDGGGTGGQAKWTYLIYMAADNNLSDMATLNVKQMIAARSSRDVRIVVQVEQNPQETPGAERMTLRGTVENGASQLQNLGRNVDMSSRAALTEFIRWGKQNYPAERYALVLWSHGGGWKADKSTRGALQDVSSREDLMSVRDMAAAVKDAGGVDVLNFDACLMAMYEVAYEMRQAAKVMVASEEVIPGQGNPYDKVINRLVANPSQDAATFAKGIVTDYMAYYRTNNRQSVTLSAIDLAAVEPLHAKVKAAAAGMVAAMAGERLNIQAARDASPSYNHPNNHDLIVFAKALAGRASSTTLRTLANELAAAAQAAVLANDVQQLPGELNVAGSTGLAIYLPSPAHTTTSELNAYRTVLASNTVAGNETAWSTFTTALVTNGGGTGQTDATGPFAYGIRWDNPDVDLDLMVNEPQGNWAGPAIGPSSVNGFASADSWDAGQAEETYTANSQLEKGAYDVFVQYAGCAKGRATCGDTTVSVYRYDPSLGDTSAVLLGTRRMSAAPALPSMDSFATFEAFVNAVDSDAYADWLFVRRVTRDLPADRKVLPAQPKPRGKGFGAVVTK
jgi:hypothetical protein